MFFRHFLGELFFLQMPLVFYVGSLFLHHLLRLTIYQQENSYLMYIGYHPINNKKEHIVLSYKIVQFFSQTVILNSYYLVSCQLQ